MEMAVIIISKFLQEKFKREFQQRCPFRPRKLSISPPTDSIDLDKTQSTRTSIRYILRCFSHIIKSRYYYKKMFSWKGRIFSGNINLIIVELLSRYDWRRTGSSGYPSFYRGVPMRESSKISINGNNESISRQKSTSTRWTRNEQKNQYCPDQRSPSKAAELYVFSSGRHKRTKSIGTEELCL